MIHFQLPLPCFASNLNIVKLCLLHKQSQRNKEFENVFSSVKMVLHSVAAFNWWHMCAGYPFPSSLIMHLFWFWNILIVKLKSVHCFRHRIIFSHCLHGIQKVKWKSGFGRLSFVEWNGRAISSGSVYSLCMVRKCGRNGSTTVLQWKIIYDITYRNISGPKIPLALWRAIWPIDRLVNLNRYWNSAIWNHFHPILNETLAVSLYSFIYILCIGYYDQNDL